MKPLVEVKQLSKSYTLKDKCLTAVNAVSFEIHPSETLGLVGESGCGKSTTGRCILGLERPSAGSVFFDGKDISAFSKEEMHLFRQKAQVIFQDPYASLNPRMTTAEILAEPLQIHHLLPKENIQDRVAELLEFVS